MEFFKPLYDTITNKQEKVSYRLIIALIAILALILVDNTLGFTFYYDSKNKVELVQLLNDIIKDTT